MVIVFDTETTGLPLRYNAPLTDFNNWPRVVQLAWQLHDFDGTLIEQRSAIILPEDFEIPYAASKIHHITTAWALTKGEPFLQVIQDFLKAFERATCYVGHNIEFDRMVLGCELLRRNLQDCFLEKPFIDTKSNETT